MIQGLNYDIVSDMAALQEFYSIPSAQEGSFNKMPAWKVQNLLFRDIAATFGLTYWL